MDILAITDLRNRRSRNGYDFALVSYQANLVRIDEQLHVASRFYIRYRPSVVCDFVPVVPSEHCNRHRQAENHGQKLIHPETPLTSKVAPKCTSVLLLGRHNQIDTRQSNGGPLKPDFGFEWGSSTAGESLLFLLLCFRVVQARSGSRGFSGVRVPGPPLREPGDAS